MKHINLILGCHAHQPVGNFDFVFEEAYAKSYKPFVDVLERFPLVRVTLHYTGPLWDWFLVHEPAFITRLARLARSGQVEIMGGGYYEPLLCAIPERDAQAQIAHMQAFCLEHLGVEPRGMWLTERVWEPHMARILACSGVEYAALDDSHFLCSGHRPSDLYGYYMTEEEGETLKVFPIQEKLRYLVPFQPVEDTIEYLRDLATEDGGRCAVVHDDAEKFGVWPGTYSSVYEEGWLEDFFQALTDNASWLHSVTYSQHLDTHPPVGRTYITCASYQEMMAWALPTDRQRELRAAKEHLAQYPELEDQCAPFLRGGFWRNFLSKYPEANTMQKRMIRVSKRVERLRAHAGEPDFEAARLHLLMAQCNCAYWHGQFGGLYLNHLRTALYEHIIRAACALDAVEAPASPVSVEMVDFDGDGQVECILENALLAVYLSPHNGGTILSLDYKPKAFNLCNTLARREEPYHDTLLVEASRDAQEDVSVHSIHDPFPSKESGLDALLFQDGYRRSSLRDHFLACNTDVEALYRNKTQELAALPEAPYEVVDRAGGTIILVAEAPFLCGIDGALHVTKKIECCADESLLQISYDIRNDSVVEVSGIFSPESTINLLTGSSPDRYFHTEDRDLARPMLGTHGTEHNLRHFSLRDEWMELETGFRMKDAVTFRFFPLETISQSECGQERVHQGSVVFPCWPMTLNPGETISLEFIWYVTQLQAAQA